MRCILMVLVGFLLTIPVPLAAQESEPSETVVTDNDDHASESDAATASPEKDRATKLYEGIVVTFVLLMFTNAIQCGQWAIQTKRNFWGWYLAGLFTGPLAGGCMLYHTSVDTNPDAAQGGCLAALAGILIPAAGWLIWFAILL